MNEVMLPGDGRGDSGNSGDNDGNANVMVMT